MSTTGIDLPTYKERFRREAAARGVPEARAEAFLAVMRPRVGLISTPNDGGVVFRYGGLPRMPDGVDWPGSASFLGALDCEAIPRAQLDLPYPESGELLFFWEGHDNVFEPWGEVIHVADPSTASPRQRPGGPGAYADPVDYFATPQVHLPWDTGFYDDVAFEGLDDVAKAVEATWEDPWCDFALGGFPNCTGGPEWDIPDGIGEWPAERGERPTYTQLRGEYRVLLLSDSDPLFNSRLNYVIRAQDLAAGRYDTVSMVADVND